VSLSGRSAIRDHIRGADPEDRHGGMLKVELHTHTSDDPIDKIPHTVPALIDRAAALGYHALAITLHDHQLDIRWFTSYARERGIVLIPGVERTIHGRHVLLLNFRRGAADVRTFEDLARLKRRAAGLVVAPHPFFPAPTCLGSYLDRYPLLFDAIEFNAMFTASVNFNRRAERWAAQYGKPTVGNCDVHRLHQLGTTYSLVDAEPHPDAICAAIAAGRVRVESRPLTWIEVARTMGAMFLSDFAPRSEPRLTHARSNPGLIRILRSKIWPVSFVKPDDTFRSAADSERG
jgi:predicted metal-dependent phosphoesterase TrpH